MTEVNVADLQAIGDIADWLIEESDSLPTDRAIELLEACTVAAAKLKMAMSMLQSQALSTIEQPILIGRVAWAKKPTFKQRPNQSLIAATVIDFAARPDNNGEVPTAHEAATTATNLMRGLYVSPSTVPKVGGVKDLDLEMSDVTREEHVGFELKRTEID